MVCSLIFFSLLFSEWATQPLQRQSSSNNNSHDEILNNSPLNCGVELVALNTSSSSVRLEIKDIYLGGSTETASTWREDIAIPLVKKHGLTYYNPTLREENVTEEQNCLFNNLANDSICVSNGDTELNPDHHRKLEKFVLRWKRTMDNSKVLLFVITNDTRSLTTMVLAAHYVGLSKNIVLCIQQLPVEDSEICNEKVNLSYIILMCVTHSLLLIHSSTCTFIIIRDSFRGTFLLATLGQLPHELS